MEELLEDWKKDSITHFPRGQEGGSGKLQVSQPHLHLWEDNGADYSGCQLQESGRKEDYQEE